MVKYTRLRLSLKTCNRERKRRAIIIFNFLRIFLSTMTTSRRLADRKVSKFDKNITKRGSVAESTGTKKKSEYPVGPYLIGFFVFVVIGSSLFQIIRTATSGGGMA